MSPTDQHPQQQSLYRRHRPRTFDEVVGQEAVVRTLRNAVERGKVHHAYLFVGSRGTGKTSTAKILAACLNCERGPTIDPCGECDSCQSIARASSLDVIEMDAASNNSVEDIRELRESVAYAPVSGRRKVYILDEAHMLSTAAWNAFLKTLEEPPPNTVFVLATTDAMKVPATVIDRCHRFDFHRPTVEQIAGVVRRAAQAEGIELPSAAVTAVARSATGSFRDALGTLEQLITYGGSEVALADVLAVLGVADERLLEAALDAVAGGDARAALKTLAECVEQGRDASSFALDLEVRARELLVVQTLGEVPAELSLTAEADASLLAQAGRVEQAVLVHLLEALGEAMEAVRAGADPRTRLELALVKTGRPEVDTKIAGVHRRLERLERERGVVSAVARQREVPAGDSQAFPQGAAGSESEAGAVDAAAPSSTEAEATADRGRSPVATPPLDADVQSLGSLWPAVVDLVRAANAMLGALIEEARPVAVAGDELTVAFAASAPFLKKKAEDPANRAAVTAALREVAGGRWRLRYELSGELDSPKQAQAAGRSEQDWIRHFIDEFDAEELGSEQPTAGKGASEQPPSGQAPAAPPAPLHAQESVGREEPAGREESLGREESVGRERQGA